MGSLVIPHWDIVTLIFYVIMGVICSREIGKAKQRERESNNTKKSIFTAPYVVLWIILICVATFRQISVGIGGSDAITYKKFFEMCLSDNINHYYEHYDILYKLINYVIRFFTDNYYVFSVIFYGFIAFSFIYFINEFSDSDNSRIPYILLFFLYLRGFTSYRTELTIAFILLSIVLYKKEKKILAYLLAGASFFIQKASILYALCLFFLEFYNKRKIKISHLLLFCIITIISGSIAQKYVIQFFADDTTSAYAYYAKLSLNTSFFTNFWKICFEQLILLVLTVIFKKEIDKECYLGKYSKENDIILKVCIFDYILIPITYILSIWRGYEYMYIPRLILLSLIIKLFNRKCTGYTRKIFSILFYIIIISWMVFRINHTWEDSCLMPYIFEPLHALLYE